MGLCAARSGVTKGSIKHFFNIYAYLPTPGNTVMWEVRSMDPEMAGPGLVWHGERAYLALCKGHQTNY